MAGVICPAIIGMNEVGVGRTCPIYGNGVPGGRVGYGERATVSSSAIFRTTSAGVVMMNPGMSSLIMERSVGSVVEVVFPT